MIVVSNGLKCSNSSCAYIYTNDDAQQYVYAEEANKIKDNTSNGGWGDIFYSSHRSDSPSLRSDYTGSGTGVTFSNDVTTQTIAASMVGDTNNGFSEITIDVIGEGLSETLGDVTGKAITEVAAEGVSDVIGEVASGGAESVLEGVVGAIGEMFLG